MYKIKRYFVPLVFLYEPKKWLLIPKLTSFNLSIDSLPSHIPLPADTLRAMLESGFILVRTRKTGGGFGDRSRKNMRRRPADDRRLIYEEIVELDMGSPFFFLCRWIGSVHGSASSSLTGMRDKREICSSQERAFTNHLQSLFLQHDQRTIRFNVQKKLIRWYQAKSLFVKNFIDLAGSERASQAMSAGARLKEGYYINRSLLTLGTVIQKLRSRGCECRYTYNEDSVLALPNDNGNRGCCSYESIDVPSVEVRGTNQLFKETSKTKAKSFTEENLL